MRKILLTLIGLFFLWAIHAQPILYCLTTGEPIYNARYTLISQRGTISKFDVATDTLTAAYIFEDHVFGAPGTIGDLPIACF